MIINSDPFGVATTTVAISAPANVAVLSSADNVDAEMALSYGSLATTGGADLDADMSGEDRFIFDIVGTVDVNAEIFLDIDTGTGLFGYTAPLPSGTGGGFELFFADITGFPAASSDVDGLKFTFRPQDGVTDLDVTVQNIVATTPEPGTLSLLALGGLGLLRRRRRK
jgi:hypothetical protein